MSQTKTVEQIVEELEKRPGKRAFEKTTWTFKPIAVTDVHASIHENHPDLFGLPKFLMITIFPDRNLQYYCFIDLPQYFVLTDERTGVDYLVNSEGYNYAYMVTRIERD